MQKKDSACPQPKSKESATLENLKYSFTKQNALLGEEEEQSEKASGRRLHLPSEQKTEGKLETDTGKKFKRNNMRSKTVKDVWGMGAKDPLREQAGAKRSGWRCRLGSPRGQDGRAQPGLYLAGQWVPDSRADD